MKYGARPNIRKWKKWMSEICLKLYYISDVFLTQEDFWKIAGISPVATKRHTFWGYVNRSFYTEIAMQLSVITDGQFRDKDKRVVSLYALIQELEHHHQYFTRKWFVGRENPPRIPKKFKDKKHQDDIYWKRHDYFHYDSAFSEYFGKNRKTVGKDYFTRDLKKIDKLTNKLRSYRNKVLAHNSNNKKRITKGPSLDELRDVIQELIDIAKIYYILLAKTGFVYESRRGDLNDLFNIAWLDEGTSLKYNESIEESIKSKPRKRRKPQKK